MLTETGDQAHQNHHQTEKAAISGVVAQVAGKEIGDAVAGGAGQSSYPNAGQTGVIEEKTRRWWGKHGYDYTGRGGDGARSRHLSKHLVKLKPQEA
jgi:hypothetical protein